MNPDEGKETMDFSLLKETTVLYVEDDTQVHKHIRKFLKNFVKEVYSAFNGREGWDMFKQHLPDIVLTDCRMPKMSGLEMAEKIKGSHPVTPIIVISAFAEVELLMKAIDIGVDKYVKKPVDGDKLLETIYWGALPVHQEKKIHRLNKTIFASLEARISRSQAMKEVIRQIHKVANSDFSVIIQGETGAGKSTVARLIHNISRRAGKPFITIDIGAIPETLVESELFGHVKGAFTGAEKNKKGFFEIAHEGTLFLEEMENMNPYIQGKLLRAVEEKCFCPVGSTTPVEVDIRIISATNKNISDEVKKDKFRQDLFYRLCEFDIHIPPLRERPEDIPLLASEFANEVAAELGRHPTDISLEAVGVLAGHRWNGNVRELKNVIRRSVLLCEGEKITAPDILKILNTKIDEPHQPTSTQTPLSPPEPGDYSLSFAVEEAESQAIRRALAKSAGKKVNTASLLNINFKTLVTKMEKYGIS